MTTFKPGDKVRLKPNQSSEDEVLAYLNYDTVYTVHSFEPPPNPTGRVAGMIVLEGDEGLGCVQWLAKRFELVREALVVPASGDEVEVVLRAKVTAVQKDVENAGTIVYFEEIDGRHIAPVYLNSAVQSLTVVKPTKLDLDALPEGAVVEAFDYDPLRSFIYRKSRTGVLRPWVGMQGVEFSAADLYEKHDELVELVRKDAPA